MYAGSRPPWDPSPLHYSALGRPSILPPLAPLRYGGRPNRQSGFPENYPAVLVISLRDASFLILVPAVPLLSYPVEYLKIHLLLEIRYPCSGSSAASPPFAIRGGQHRASQSVRWTGILCDLSGAAFIAAARTLKILPFCANPASVRLITLWSTIR